MDRPPSLRPIKTLRSDERMRTHTPSQRTRMCVPVQMREIKINRNKGNQQVGFWGVVRAPVPHVVMVMMKKKTAAPKLRRSTPSDPRQSWLSPQPARTADKGTLTPVTSPRELLSKTGSEFWNVDVQNGSFTLIHSSGRVRCGIRFKWPNSKLLNDVTKFTI